MARILIVDDEEDVRTLLCRALAIAGHEAVTAKEGNEAMARLRESPVDLAIVDLYMPGKDGIETIMDMRRRYPAIKIIAMTGSAPTTGTPVLAMAHRLGAHRTLPKPFSVEELLAGILALLGEPPSAEKPPA
jgi:DNA-binding response OmpR family regulator